MKIRPYEIREYPSIICSSIFEKAIVWFLLDRKLATPKN